MTGPWELVGEYETGAQARDHEKRPDWRYGIWHNRKRIDRRSHYCPAAVAKIRAQLTEMLARRMRPRRPKEWTAAEVVRLGLLARRKTSAEEIAKSLGRPVASVRRKAGELNLLLYKKRAPRINS